MELIKDYNFYKNCLKYIHINESWDFNNAVKNKLTRYNTFEDYLKSIHIHIRNTHVNYKRLYEQLLNRYYIDYLNGPLNLYESFTQYDLYEGLTFSYPPGTFAKYLYNKYETIQNIDTTDTGKILIHCFIKDNKILKDSISKSDLNLGGYFLEREGIDKKYNQFYFLLYAPKYDFFDYTDYVYNDLNGIVYHITKKAYVDKIIKYGLVPKSKNKGCIHPDRIYVLCEQPLSKYKFFAKDLYKNDGDIYCLLKINLKQHILYIHNKTQLKFLNDPNVPLDIDNIPVAFYTYENISPNCVEYICDLN